MKEYHKVIDKNSYSIWIQYWIKIFGIGFYIQKNAVGWDRIIKYRISVYFLFVNVVVDIFDIA